MVVIFWVCPLVTQMTKMMKMMKMSQLISNWQKVRHSGAVLITHKNAETNFTVRFHLASSLFLGTPKRKRVSKHSVVELLKTKFDRKASLKEQELQQRQLEFEFEKAKFEFEADERKKRLNMELEERKALLNVLKDKL